MATMQEQVAWLTTSAGVFLTSDRVVSLRGDDSLSWLNGQVTADVRELSTERAIYALSVSLKGRVHTDLWAVRNEQGFAVVLPALCAETALMAFEKHIIMEDVELVAEPELRVVSIQGPSAAQLLERLAPRGVRYSCQRLSPQPGVDLWVPKDELAVVLTACEQAVAGIGGGMVDEAGWAHAHIALGIARAGVDFGSDTYPQEAGLKARSVSFSKGCYTGQEVVYMLEKRGQLARRLVQMSGPAVTAKSGDQVLDADGQRIGEVTSVTQTADGELALAYLKRAHAAAGASVQLHQTTWQVRCVLGENEAGCPIVASA